MAKKSSKKSSFFDNPYGGMFDFDGDGKEGLLELLLGKQIMTEIEKEEKQNLWRQAYDDIGMDYGLYVEDYDTKEEFEEALHEARYGWRDYYEYDLEYDIDPNNYETEEEYEEALENAIERYGWREKCEDGSDYYIDPHDYEKEDDYNAALHKAKYGWCEHCEDGSDYGIDPDDYETEDEYNDALEEAKYEWRDYCEDGSDYDIDPEDYETEEEYNEALEEAKYELYDEDEEEYEEDENRITEEDFINKRRYEAAYYLHNFSCDDDLDTQCCEFIIEKADKIVAANYLSYTSGFLYAQAVKENFELPISLPDEDLEREYDFYKVIKKIATRDKLLALQVWDWCLQQFIPYAEYDQYARADLTNEVLDFLSDFPDGFINELLVYMKENDCFRQHLIEADSSISDDFSQIIVLAIKEGYNDFSIKLFESLLKKANNQWKVINRFVEWMIDACENYKEIETMEYFRDKLFPFVKSIPVGMVQDEIDEWEKQIAKYIDTVEDECEKYAYTRKNSWRKSVVGAKEYGLDPCDYSNEAEYLEALEEAKYAWRKWYENEDNLGLDVYDFETEEEFEDQEERQRLIEEALNDKKIYSVCGVLLNQDLTVKYYLAIDDTLKIGDLVLVSFKNKEVEGVVVAIGKTIRIAAPFSINQMKKIIRKINKNDN